MDDNGYSGSEGGGGGGTGTRGSTSFQDWDSDGDSVTPNGRKRKRTGFTGSRATSVDATSINGDFASRAQVRALFLMSRFPRTMLRPEQRRAD